MQQSQSTYVTPQTTFASAPALEVRPLGGGREITQKQALTEVEALNEPAAPDFVWRLETWQELAALVDLGHKNQHGAYTRDDSLQRHYYWTADKHPEFSGARVVVGFRYSSVDFDLGSKRCLARAVRVARQ